MGQHLKDKQSFEQAGKNLLGKVYDAESGNQQEAQSSWRQIEARMAHFRTLSRKRTRYALSVATSIALIIGVGFCFWINAGREYSLSLALLENNTPLSGNEIVLIDVDDAMQLQDRPSITYDIHGTSNVQHYVVKKDSTGNGTDINKEINQIIVPKGKRADITFSDGTKMYVNAGTRVFYPAVFGKDSREIVVEGEVYLDVTPDPSRPFIVKANGFDVKVVGTQFNVCAHRNNASASVVLVNGRVEVISGKNNKSVLSPNQIMEISDQGAEIREVDVIEYICWKDDIMLLNDRRLGETLDRLSQYYDCAIVYDSATGDIPLSGKLDLQGDIEHVLDIICQSLFLRYEIDENNNITILK